jgi:hypothetical protein
MDLIALAIHVKRKEKLDSLCLILSMLHSLFAVDSPMVVSAVLAFLKGNPASQASSKTQ